MKTVPARRRHSVGGGGGASAAAHIGTLFVRVNTGATENAGIENARRSKRDTRKPETDTHYRIKRLTYDYILPVPLSLKPEILC